MALDRDEQVEILETIARDGSDSNRIQAIRELNRLQDDTGDDDDEFERGLTAWHGAHGVHVKSQPK